MSGDLYSHFTFCNIPITFYTGSIVVEDITIAGDTTAMVLSGPVIYYSDPGNNADSIEVRIPRVNYFASPAAAWCNPMSVRRYPNIFVPPPCCPRSMAINQRLTPLRKAAESIIDDLEDRLKAVKRRKR